MIWLNPWAWAGLLTLGVPVLIHMLSRRRATVRKFPTLRFLESSRLTPTRRTRLSDILLLAVRLGILSAAVAALARPVLLTANRKRDLGSAHARAIVVDTSVSMRRLTPAGGRALDSAQRVAQTLASDAGTSVILQSAIPARSLAGAVAWLGTQPGTHELIIASDFQVGTLDSTDLGVAPLEVGVRLVRIPTKPSSAPIELSIQSGGGGETVARVTLAPNRTDVDWITERATIAPPSSALLLLSGALERGRADAAKQAALTVGSLTLSNDEKTQEPDTNRLVAIVFPGFEQRAELLHDVKPLDQPWMADVVARLRNDSMLVVAASTASAIAPSAATLDSASFLVVAKDAAGRAIILAARGSYQGHDRLLLFSRADAGSLTSASLIAATTRARYPTPPVSELEPTSLSDETLQRWERPAAVTVTSPHALDSTDASDGRWLWVVALLLLAVETWIRRAPRESSTAMEVAHERVA